MITRVFLSLRISDVTGRGRETRQSRAISVEVFDWRVLTLHVVTNDKWSQATAAWALRPAQNEFVTSSSAH